MFYHASSVKGIKLLEPRISNHNIPLIYFSEKRENVLVYLCNAVEKFCKETGFAYSGVWHKWASYGFDNNGILTLEEYYPNALLETYKGISGYIYSARHINNSGDNIRIPYAATSREAVKVSDCEFVEDAYEEIIKAEKNGLIRVMRFDQLNEAKLNWIASIIKQEYENAIDHPEYRYFIENKFAIKL